MAMPLTQKFSKTPQPEVLSRFNTENNSGYQAFENEDGTVWLYWNEVLMTEIANVELFEGWASYDGP